MVIPFAVIAVGMQAQTRKPVAVFKNISVAGRWQFATDPGDIGLQQKWFEPTAAVFNDTIHLPGSMAGNGKGN
ncbi:MAG: hypothetical protein JST39_05570, partial [Bacteroidetes bacterium]|nr:hypothetical protein [Bacteroidota bacterium]